MNKSFKIVNNIVFYKETGMYYYKYLFFDSCFNQMNFLNNNLYNIYFYIYIFIISVKTYIEAKGNKVNLQLLNRLGLLICKKLLRYLLETFL